MKIVAFYVQYSREAREHAPLLVLDEKRKVKSDFLKKGAVLKFWRQEEGQLNDDFIRDMWATMVKYKYFKAPRFVTNTLIKKSKI